MANIHFAPDKIPLSKPAKSKKTKVKDSSRIPCDRQPLFMIDSHLALDKIPLPKAKEILLKDTTRPATLTKARRLLRISANIQLQQNIELL